MWQAAQLELNRALPATGSPSWENIPAENKKAKIIKVQIPEKINTFLKENFNNDIKYLEKKNKIKINFDDDKSLLVPEYLIEFQNKSKKVLDKMENKIEIKKYHKENNA